MSADYYLGVLVGLASATNSEIARTASMHVHRDHHGEILLLQDRIAELERTLAGLLTAEELTTLARHWHGGVGFTAGEWDARDAAHARLMSFLPQVAPTTPTEPTPSSPSDVMHAETWPE